MILYTHNIDRALSTAIGTEGTSPQSMDAAMRRIPGIVEVLKTKKKKVPVLSLIAVIPVPAQVA